MRDPGPAGREGRWKSSSTAEAVLWDAWLWREFVVARGFCSGPHPLQETRVHPSRRSRPIRKVRE